MPDNLANLHTAVGRLEAKVDLLLEYRLEQNAADAARESRISSLERWRSLLLGGWAVTMGVLAMLFGRT